MVSHTAQIEAECVPCVQVIRSMIPYPSIVWLLPMADVETVTFVRRVFPLQAQHYEKYSPFIMSYQASL